METAVGLRLDIADFHRAAIGEKDEGLIDHLAQDHGSRAWGGGAAGDHRG